MKRFEKLAYLNSIANECFNDNDLRLEAKYHNEFMKVAQQKRTYKVLEFRELLMDIADKTGVAVNKLKFYNPSIKGEIVYQGQVLNLGPAPKTDKPGEHTVSSGETGAKIASMYNTSVKMLQKLNPRYDINKLLPGDVLKVPVSKSSLDEMPDMMAEDEPEM